MLKIKEGMNFSFNRKRGLFEPLEIKGLYIGEHYRKGKLIEKYPVNNLVTNAGKNDLWDVYFSDGTQKAAADWAMGLINVSGYTAIAAADTSASHAGWTEYTAYTQTTRPLWGPGNPSSQAVTNATACVFDFNATGSLKGIFIISSATKSGTTGILFSEGLFPANVDVVADDQIRLTYTAAL